MENPSWPESHEGLALSEQNQESDNEKGSPRVLSLKLSFSLHRKLLKKAQSEGVTIEEFASELLAEGLVLRAWEIMERKTTMRGPGGNLSNPPNGRNQNNGRNGFRNPNVPFSKRSSGGLNGDHSNHYSGGGSRANYNNIMEDSANFLEYVRNQEKKQK